MYRLVDAFTTRDGKWEADGRAYGIDQEHVEKYGEWKNELGCATCIFARIEGGDAKKIRFFTRDNQQQVTAEVKAGGWANYPLTHGNAGYNPETSTGWWNAHVEGYPSEVARNIGLPMSEHISTFLVFRWEEQAGQLPDEGPTPIEEPKDDNDPGEPDSLENYPIQVSFNWQGEQYEGYVRRVE